MSLTEIMALNRVKWKGKKFLPTTYIKKQDFCGVDKW